MSQTTLEISSGSPYAILVTFTWGSHVARYCRWTDDLTVGSDTFTCEPSLKVFFDKPQSGMVEDSPVFVQMKLSRSPFDKLGQTYPHAKVDVKVEEIAPGDNSTRQELFTGRLSVMQVRPSGVGLLGKAKVVGVKARLQGSVGMQALTTCAAPSLGHGQCLFDLAADGTRSGTVTVIGTNSVPNRITVSISGGAFDTTNDLWRRGYVEVDSLRISIRKMFSDLRVDLREIPPPDWAAQPMTIVMGCAKTIGVCRLHGQEEQFSAYGIAMPARNPLFEGA